MMAAIMTKMTPQNKRPREAFFFTLRLTVQSSYAETRCQQNWQRGGRSGGDVIRTGRGMESRYMSVTISGMRTE
jgi:hypothetical protein